MKTFIHFLPALTLLAAPLTHTAAEPVHISGVYPHLTMFNAENECGTGALVPWAGKLWAITYAPHKPMGSSDKLYEISPDLKQTIRPESIGGTPANRMIHRESNQLFIGPYAIDASGTVRTIPVAKMPGRHTGNARHLTDPSGKIYYATMEEGLYEVDVNTLAVTELIKDGNRQNAVGNGIKTALPGYHGKGLYSGQGRVIYSNNGEHGTAARTNPTTESGALAQWDGSGDWQLVRRNQFTEVTGPNGIYGGENPEKDPVWAMGWDARSLLLALLEDGAWTYYRLPKGSHSYDGAHGWNTEWPRIREIGEDDLLATMHGTFWRFPAGFSKAQSSGIAPRSNYLKVIGDFCRWNDQLVLGCDDSAKAEFLNTRPFKAPHAAPLQSNSNLWFIDPDQLDTFGPVIGRGSVWLRDDVKADTPSDPYLFSGYDHRQLTLSHAEEFPVTFTLQIDREGNDTWTPLRTITVAHTEHIVFAPRERGAWIRVVADRDAKQTTAHFHYRNTDPRDTANAPLFAGIATPEQASTTQGVMRSLAFDTLGLVTADGTLYELDPTLSFTRSTDTNKARALRSAVAQPARAYEVDAASVVIEEDGQRYRLPKNPLYTTTPEPASTEASQENLARGATVRASSTTEGFAPEHVVDGHITDESRWVSKPTGDKAITLSFDKPVRFQSVRITTGWKNDPAYAARHLALQTRVDGQWKTLPDAEVTDNRHLACVINLRQPLTTETLRIVSNDPNYVRIYEIEIFSGLAPSTTPVVEQGLARVCREVATERDLLNVHGTFYELPARNAQGLAKVRPVATHNLAVHDYCSHAGLLFFTGIDTTTQSEHIFRSDDGKAAVWAGVVDDLWKLGKPRGQGGPWHETSVQAGVPSDPYLMTGYDRKSVYLQSAQATRVDLEVDIDGTGLWVPYRSFDLAAGQSLHHQFPLAFSAYWVRAVSASDTTATVQFTYE